MLNYVFYANHGCDVRYELKADGYHGVKSSIVCPWFISTGLFAGARSDIIPFLEPSFVADSIVTGVLADEEVIFIPRMMYFLNFLKSFMPSRAFYKIFEALKGTTAMDTFTGRHGHPSGDTKANGEVNGQTRAL